jgi:hypothetical protein
VACALLIAACSLGVSVELAASAAPAKAAPAKTAPASTSQAGGQPQCRPAWPERLTGAFFAVSHSQIIIGEPGHGRNC